MKPRNDAGAGSYSPLPEFRCGQPPSQFSEQSPTIPVQSEVPGKRLEDLLALLNTQRPEVVVLLLSGSTARNAERLGTPTVADLEKAHSDGGAGRALLRSGQQGRIRALAVLMWSAFSSGTAKRVARG